MSASWREFTSWVCQSCGEENIIIQNASGCVEAAIFERSCSACGAIAPGTTIRPAGIDYRITTPRAFYVPARRWR